MPPLRYTTIALYSCGALSRSRHYAWYRKVRTILGLQGIDVLGPVREAIAPKSTN